MCWNLALSPEDKRETEIEKMKSALKMTDEELADVRQSLILPMIHRHHEMFPGLHSRSKQSPNMAGIVSSPPKKYPGADRYAPCPCGSGRKYKFCCGASK
jgi:uncharacterized protein YecA (UPF0149 family)